MRIAVVSDTHGHVANAGAAVELIRTERVQAVLHCGDIGSPAVVRLFDEWPAHFVLGNVDHDGDRLGAAIRDAGQSFHDRFAALKLDGVTIALLHSDDQRLFEATIESGNYDLVCYGHTHLAEQHRVDRTLVLNPGALYRATPHTFAVVDLPELRVRHVVVS